MIVEWMERIMVGHNRQTGWCRNRNKVWTRPHDADCPDCSAKAGEECVIPEHPGGGMTHVRRPIVFWDRDR